LPLQNILEYSADIDRTMAKVASAAILEDAHKYSTDSANSSNSINSSFIEFKNPKTIRLV